MAINSPENQNINSSNWHDSKKPALCCNESISSNASSKRQRKCFVSPYLNGDKVKLHSKFTEKNVIQKQTTDFMSSFPLAANIYKANSDEFKIAKRASKKGKKCVHTLAIGPSTQPNICTVSDMNDSEYNETKISRKPKPKAKKRKVNKNLPEKNIQIYDRDARYCSEFNINLDSSSSDMFQHLTGDGKKVFKKAKNNYGRNQIIDNDVWAVLRNINKMQFIPSPPMSGTSAESIKIKSAKRRNHNHTDSSYIETCRTEEFAYISYDNASLNSQSRSSSFDRVTVIGKQDDVKKTYTYTKTDFRGLQRKQEVGANLRKTGQSRNINNQTDKQQLQQQSRTQKSLSHKRRSTVGDILLNKDETQKKTSEGQMKAIDYETKTSKQNILLKEPEKSRIPPETERQEQLKGITRVVLSKGVETHNNNSNQHEEKKCQLVTYLPSRGHQVKLTTTEIKKKLTKLKYPIVVTGKETLSSYIQVIDYEPPQFSGLDKNIWPFMIKWLPESQKAAMCTEIKKISECAQTPKTNIKGSGDMNANLKNNDTIKHSKSKLNKPQISQNVTSKERPLHVFRDRMINFMYSNKYSIVPNTKSYINCNMNKVDTNASNSETQKNRIGFRKDKLSFPMPTKDTVNAVHLKNTQKHTWSKIKWASDFIENVIKKVKCGVYYGHDNRKIVKDITADAKSTQTDNLLDINVEDVSNEKFYNEVIPGFENKSQDLELQTVSKNQIAVKNCNTNVVVQFDIAFPLEKINILQKKRSILPPKIEISENRIFKYKATITNAVLPAELCSIIPQMLNNIKDSKTIPVLYQETIETLSLFPIIESRRYECIDSISTALCNITTTPHLKILQNGRFSNLDKSKLIAKPKSLDYVLGFSAIDKLLLERDRKPWFENINGVYKISQPMFQKDTEYTQIQQNTCTAIVPYVPRTTTVLNNLNTNPTKTCVNLDIKKRLKIECFEADSVVLLHDDSMVKVCLVVNNINCLFLQNYNFLFNIHYKPLNYDSTVNFDKEQSDLSTNKSALIIKKFNNRKKYVKLCKKCKSTSSLTHYKKSTRLQKIANLDEFFQALGSAKYLASVIDGDTERKILSSIVEMKYWITEMTPKQALLILLLSNKKETSNIIRCRRFILQGIAMNRITKVSELDMELEVIEREDLNNSVQCDGISYIPASAENQNTLLEELYWIAKTTASDYQKTFDKSSERLLKSLLSKRKKLNPSYLRVMARYVGLGLLKIK